MTHHRKKSMQCYPKYEPVDFDYVRELPAGWQLVPNIAIFAERVERGHLNEELLAVTISKGIIKQTELEHKKDISNDDKSHYKFVQCGDIAYNKMRMWQGAVGYSQYQGIVSPAYVVLSPKVPLNPRFFHYLFRTGFYANYSKRFSYGICDDQLSLRSKDFKRMYAIVPPLDVQDAIVAYLDRKSARANDFIAKQTRLVEVLKEQKQAVINQAVTKGLNPDAPLKESGIEWIGKIPAHWEVMHLKYLLNGGLVNGIFKTKDNFGRGVKIINVSDIYSENFFINFANLERVKVSTNEVKRYEVSHGDIFFVRSSLKLEGVGASACIVELLEPTIFECHVIRIHPNPQKILPEYLIHYLNSLNTRQRLVALSETVTMTTISQPKISSIGIVVPPIKEQKDVFSRIENESMKIDRAIAKAEKQMALARDYLHSLIFQVVTGQRAVPSATMTQRSQA